MSSVFATGADERYGWHLLNLLGSLRINSDVFDRVVAYDLGLSGEQRALLDEVRGVQVREIPALVPHWSQGFTWKPWAWTHLDAGEIVFWLDAGATILRSLAPALDAVRERGYFLVSQGRRLHEIVPSDCYELYGLPRSAGGREYVAAGIVGFRVGGDFYERVIVSTYEDCLLGRSMGFSPDEAPALNRGLQASDAPILRDSVHFRWDQSVFNIRLAMAYEEPVVADLDEYGGYRSRRDHPRQVIWNHRREGNLAYLTRVDYERDRLRRRLVGLRLRARWWWRLHRRWFTASTYAWKLRKELGRVRRRSAPT